MHTLVAATVARTDDDVLLVEEGKEAVRGTWNLPGGRVEAGEDPRETAAREFTEEVGVDVELTGLVGVYLGRDAFVDGPFLSVTYLGQVSEEPRAVATDSVAAARWIDRDRLDELALRSPYVSRAIHDADERTFPTTVVRSIPE
ncbi:NUDIX hydrolase [Halopenitus persicus]|uniref:NUDIX hydrolase n=1 Tax=Halopenitus persicus TaxID=1048396 RepID=UPI0012FDD1F0|nr:NUDIX domain-containing protein [Halopenitus persicus]